MLIVCFTNGGMFHVRMALAQLSFYSVVLSVLLCLLFLHKSHPLTSILLLHQRMLHMPELNLTMTGRSFPCLCYLLARMSSCKILNLRHGTDGVLFLLSVRTSPHMSFSLTGDILRVHDDCYDLSLHLQLRSTSAQVQFSPLSSSATKSTSSTSQSWHHYSSATAKASWTSTENKCSPKSISVSAATPQDLSPSVPPFSLRTTPKSTSIPRSPTLRPISLWTSPIMAYPSATCTGLAFQRGCPPSLPWCWSASQSPPAATLRGDVNVSRGPGIHNSYTPCPPPLSTSVPPSDRNLVSTPGHSSNLISPSTQVSFIRSPASLLPSPPLAVFPDVPLLTNAPPPSCSTPLVPPASSLLATTRFRPSHTSSRAPRRPMTRAAPARPASPPLSDKGSSSVTPAPVLRSSHIIPAHSHSDYNRRDFSRSAVPGSVSSLKVTY